MNDDVTVNETISVPKKDYDEMVEKLATTSQDKANLVNEIKELREKGQLTAAEADELRKKVEQLESGRGESQELTPEKIVEEAEKAAKRVISERDKEDAKANRKIAMERFQEAYKEFHPENDEGGIKLARLEKEIAEFNMEGLSSVQDFMKKLEKARSLVVGGGETRNEETTEVHPHIPEGGTRSEAKESKDDKLTSKELEIIDRSFGGDKARYLKIKEKRPDYVESLLQYSR